MGSYLASASDDKTIRIWRRVAEHKWDPVLVLTGHERSVYSVSWGRGPDKKRDKEWLGWLAAVGGDGKILVWQLEVFFSFSFFFLVSCLLTTFGTIPGTDIRRSEREISAIPASKTQTHRQARIGAWRARRQLCRLVSSQGI